MSYTLHVVSKDGCQPCVQLKKNLEEAGIPASHHCSPCSMDMDIGQSRPAIIVMNESEDIVHSMYGCYSIGSLLAMARRYNLVDRQDEKN